MESIWYYLSAGLLLGLSSALTPGPMMALLVSETLRDGPRSGLQIAIVPPFSDPPVIALSLAVLFQLNRVRPALGALSLLGAGFLAFLAYGNLRGRRALPDPPAAGTGALRKGLAVNWLNPNVYLFWFTVGAPLVLAAWARGFLPTLAFFLSFDLVLVGANAALVLAVARGRDLLRGRAMQWALRALGIGLLAFAAWFAWQGLRTLGIL